MRLPKVQLEDPLKTQHRCFLEPIERRKLVRSDGVLGMSVVEAFACGTPVIATSGGPSRLFLREPPLNHLLIADPDAADRFQKAATGVLNDSEVYHQAVIQRVRPRLQEIMSPQDWWRRLFELAGIQRSNNQG